jgi:hypothetical protein
MANNSPFLLSTEDNKYSPFTNYQAWYLEDLRLGYDTTGLLARMVANADEFNDIAIQYAMRDIVELNFSGKHVIVVKEDFEQ